MASETQAHNPLEAQFNEQLRQAVCWICRWLLRIFASFQDSLLAFDAVRFVICWALGPEVQQLILKDLQRFSSSNSDAGGFETGDYWVPEDAKTLLLHSTLLGQTWTPESHGHYAERLPVVGRILLQAPGSKTGKYQEAVVTALAKQVGASLLVVDSLSLVAVARAALGREAASSFTEPSGNNSSSSVLALLLSIWLAGGKAALLWELIANAIVAVPGPLILFIRDLEDTVCGSYERYDAFVHVFGTRAGRPLRNGLVLIGGCSIGETGTELTDKVRTQQASTAATAAVPGSPGPSADDSLAALIDLKLPLGDASPNARRALSKLFTTRVRLSPPPGGPLAQKHQQRLMEDAALTVREVNYRKLSAIANERRLTIPPVSCEAYAHRSLSEADWGKVLAWVVSLELLLRRKRLSELCQQQKTHSGLVKEAASTLLAAVGATAAQQPDTDGIAAAASSASDSVSEGDDDDTCSQTSEHPSEAEHGLAEDRRYKQVSKQCSSDPLLPSTLQPRPSHAAPAAGTAQAPEADTMAMQQVSLMNTAASLESAQSQQEQITDAVKAGSNMTDRGNCASDLPTETHNRAMPSAALLQHTTDAAKPETTGNSMVLRPSLASGKGSQAGAAGAPSAQGAPKGVSKGGAGRDLILKARLVRRTTGNSGPSVRARPPPRMIISEKALWYGLQMLEKSGGGIKNMVRADNAYERRLLTEVVSAEEAGFGFSEVGALESAKTALREAVQLPLQFPNLFIKGSLAAPCRGVLLFGPPGTGKTLLARAAAAECGASFMAISPSTVASKWLGDGVRYVRALFSLASKLAPCVVFVDEVDALLGRRRASEHEALREIKNEFMAQWEGLRGAGSGAVSAQRVMVLGATNRPQDLDEAVLRRFARRIFCALPSRSERVQVLKVQLASETVNKDVSLDRLADRTEGFSGSDLRQLVSAAAMRPVRELLAAHSAVQQKQKAAQLHAALHLDQATTSGAAVATSGKGQSGSQQLAEGSDTAAKRGCAVVRSREAGASPVPLASLATVSPAVLDKLLEECEAMATKTQAAAELRALTWADFEDALRQVVPTVSPDSALVSELEAWNSQYGEGSDRYNAHSKLSYFL